MKKSFHASIIAASLFAGSLAAFAAPSDFELDLKDLPGNVRSSQPHKMESRKKLKSAAATLSPSESSSYLVQPGDHLFLILMRHYGLSNDAAEQLIPEIMSLNNIHNPRSLVRGQRLTIPLPARPERMARRAEKAVVQPEISPAAIPPEPLPSPVNVTSRSVEIAAVSSCDLGRKFAEKLNLLVPSLGIIQGFSNFTAGHAGLTVAVACGELAPEEIYTYNKLLAQHGIQLLVFADDEPHRRVIEKLANHLSLPYQMDEAAGRNQLPLKVLFPTAGVGSREMRLTVLATASEKGRTLRSEQ